MLKILLLMIFPFLFLPSILNEYAIVQSNHYEMYKYMKYEKTKKIVTSFVLIGLLIAYFYCDYKYLFLLGSLIITNTSFVSSNKIKITSRIKRFILIHFIAAYLLAIIIPIKLAFLILNNLLLVYIFILHYTSLLLEKIILKHYQIEAKQIIKDKKIIGITGSYGKTTCKNIIYDMLSQIANVSKTPKSYNTKVGIIKSIRENCESIDEYFICEYGVDKVGGMDKLLDVVKPNISLITEVGPQHILSFKNIENIKKEKIKLATVLNQNEIAIINNDNTYLRSSLDNLRCKIITYGISTPSDVMAKNICISSEGSMFDLYIRNKFIKKIKIKLLGMHNVLNTLGAIGVLLALNKDLENIDKLVSNIKQVEHRLEIKKIKDIKVIDDSFNSNEKGFKNAIDVLNMMKEEKIVITPGVIEQGKNSEKVNYELGKYMSDKVDFVVLVEKNCDVIKRGLLDQNYDENKIVIKNNFFEAWDFIEEYKNINKIVLIENDLPSIYLK